jgi:hypothetical protein
MYAVGDAAVRSLLARIRQAGGMTSLDLSTITAGSPTARVDWSGCQSRYAA